MLAAIDIHKAVFQTAVLNPDDGEVLAEERFKASREQLVAWIEKWDGKLDVVAIEATTGWRWVTRELQARGIDVRLTDPGQASALQGNRKRPKTDRLDARWLVVLLARELLPDAWAPPQEIQRLRDKTRLRKSLTDDHTRWAQRLHALLVHEGWPCSRGSLLTASGRRWVAAICLHPSARAQINAMLSSPSKEHPACAGHSSKQPSTPAARTAPTTSSTVASTVTPAPTPPPSLSPARSANAPSTFCARSTRRPPPETQSSTGTAHQTGRPRARRAPV